MLIPLLSYMRQFVKCGNQVRQFVKCVDKGRQVVKCVYKVRQFVKCVDKVGQFFKCVDKVSIKYTWRGEQRPWSYAVEYIIEVSSSEAVEDVLGTKP